MEFTAEDIFIKKDILELVVMSLIYQILAIEIYI
jgi:hypothetical protein